MTPTPEKQPIVGIRELFLRHTIIIGTVLLVFFIVLLSTAYALNWPPQDFPTDASFIVEDGMSVREIGEALETAGIIRSAEYFRYLVRSSYPDLSIQAGGYIFRSPLSTLGIIDAMKHGASQNPDMVLTFPEGFSVHDLGFYTKKAFSEIDFNPYLQYEGYLFPETYFVSNTETFENLILRMRAEYEKKIEPYREKIKASGYTEEEVITLASILEREANDPISMRLVAGILENRLQADLPLQVDAVFEYILGKESHELTVEDLKLDSPYNTYIHLGLPPTPISNPGLMAIEAVLDPTPSTYFYYLTDKNGTFHYARTFEEHKQNKERYLR